jgi:hypothetical protein
LRKEVQYKEFLVQQMDGQVRECQQQMKDFEEQVDMEFQAKVA